MATNLRRPDAHASHQQLPVSKQKGSSHHMRGRHTRRLAHDPRRPPDKKLICKTCPNSLEPLFSAWPNLVFHQPPPGCARRWDGSKGNSRNRDDNTGRPPTCGATRDQHIAVHWCARPFARCLRSQPLLLWIMIRSKCRAGAKAAIAAPRGCGPTRKAGCPGDT